MIQVAGHFGELMQGKLGPDGPIALISLPCPVLHLRASLRAGEGFSISSQGVLSHSRACSFLRDLGVRLRGHVTLRSQMPIGGGAGSSTAALTALAHLAGVTCPERIARAAIRAEGASDPLMFPAAERLLWASRKGSILAKMPVLPRFEVIGGFFGAPVRTRAEDALFPDITDLLEGWPNRFAECAGLSASRSMALRGLDPQPFEVLARALGAAGWLTAHTGSARGFLFRCGEVPKAARAMLVEAGARQIVQFRSGG